MLAEQAEVFRPWSRRVVAVWLAMSMPSDVRAEPFLVAVVLHQDVDHEEWEAEGRGRNHTNQQAQREDRSEDDLSNHHRSKEIVELLENSDLRQKFGDHGLARPPLGLRLTYLKIVIK